MLRCAYKKSQRDKSIKIFRVLKLFELYYDKYGSKLWAWKELDLFYAVAMVTKNFFVNLLIAVIHRRLLLVAEIGAYIAWSYARILNYLSRNDRLRRAARPSGARLKGPLCWHSDILSWIVHISHMSFENHVEQTGRQTVNYDKDMKLNEPNNILELDS